jgi:hypothetical protein
MTEQIRLCLPAQWDGIRSLTALRIRHYDKQGHARRRSSISEKKNHWPFGKSSSFIRTAGGGTFQGTCEPGAPSLLNDQRDLDGRTAI